VEDETARLDVEVVPRVGVGEDRIELDRLRELCTARLYEGGRGYFDAAGFHRRSDSRGNILRLIRDTCATVFGSFAPVEWDSRNGKPSGQQRLMFQRPRTASGVLSPCKGMRATSERVTIRRRPQRIIARCATYRAGANSWGSAHWLCRVARFGIAGSKTCLQNTRMRK
jgi:hypothetical protein